jgi:hydroxymethylglutaryl-CoA lyase
VLVGNIPTEILIAELRQCGAKLPAFKSLNELVEANNEIASRFGSLVQ